ncbi:hypothetical protein SEA_ELEPHANTOON_97 [Mycobacterium phage Elephantoon]|nr:hypothetical protein SEA_ELEPHANTOON_97 [Mycobacterium phage Elephantoon]
MDRDDIAYELETCSIIYRRDFGNVEYANALRRAAMACVAGEGTKDQWLSVLSHAEDGMAA